MTTPALPLPPGASQPRPGPPLPYDPGATVIALPVIVTDLPPVL